jgi:hypothetical protein
MLVFQGTFYWVIRDHQGRPSRWGPARNDILPATIDNMLDVYFRGSAATTTWYMGLIRDDNFTGLSSSDTMSSHAGWEEGDEYSEATRPQWSPAPASNQLLINALGVVFSINATQTFKGLFIASNNTKLGTTGTLWSTGLFSSDQALQSGETLKAFYELKTREG